MGNDVFRTKIYIKFTLNLVWKHIYGSSNIAKKKFNEWYVVVIPLLKLLKISRKGYFSNRKILIGKPENCTLLL